MKIFGIFLAAVGLVWVLQAWNMNTVVETESKSIVGIYVPSQKVHNVGLMETRRNHLMLASVTVIVGVLLIGFGVLSGRNSKREKTQPLHSNDEFVDNLPPLYTGRGLDAHQVDDLHQAEESLRAAGISVRRDGSKWVLGDSSGAVSYVWNRNDLIAAAKTRGVPSQ